MTFGKDADPRKAGLKGLKNITDKRKKANTERNIKAWQNSDYRKKQLDNLAVARSKIDLSKAGRRSRLHENIVAMRIKPSYDHFFQPFQVCDRIGIKNGRLCFIEIKGNGHGSRKLTKEQSDFKAIIESMSLRPEYFVIT